MNIFIIIILFICLSNIEYKRGWHNAHHDIAKEINKTGSFYVGDEVFYCVKKSNKSE